MNLTDVFDEDYVQTSSSDIKSFFKINKKDKKELHKWFKDVTHILRQQASNRTLKQRENLAMYRGIDANSLFSSQFNRYGESRKKSKFVIPHIHDLTEVRVSQMTRIKPTVDVLPASGEWEDRASAKIVELIVKHLWYINNVDYDFQALHRQARIFGESYLWADWNPSKGDLHPLYVKARDMGIKKIELPDGGSIDASQPFFIGDIEYNSELPWRVLLQRKTNFKDVEYAIRIRLEPTDALLEKYPKIKVKPSQDLREFDLDSFQNNILENHTVVYEFWHKQTEEVPNGFFARYTDEECLEYGDHPYSFKGFPFIRLTDLDIPDVLNGVSKYELIAPTINMINNLNSLISRNIWLTGAAKVVLPKNAAKIESLTNDNLVLEYNGPVAPKYMQANPNPPEVYRYVESLLQQAQIIYGNHGISRGEIPTGITATSALTYLNELESQRASTDISKHSTSVVNLAKISVAIIGDKYEDDDDRLLRIVGKNNEFSIRHFHSAHLQKDYDIRFNVGSGLPDTKAGKRQIILDMMQRNAKMYEPERWEELLEVGNTEKAIDLATAAVRAADSIMEDLAAGRQVPYLDVEEDHVVHLQSYYRYVQNRQYKEEMPPERKKAIRDHIYWAEEVALEKAQTNPMFEARLAALQLFPLFPHPTYPHPRSAEQQAAVVQGAANATGQAPAGYAIPAQPLPEVK